MPHVVTKLGPVNHDQVVYGEGREIPGLTKAEAARLIQMGVIEDKPSKPVRND